MDLSAILFPRIPRSGKGHIPIPINAQKSDNFQATSPLPLTGKPVRGKKF